MARIVLISPYLKGGQNAAKLAQRTRYVATRPGVELLADERSTLPATKKQQDFIARLLKSFPSCWERRPERRRTRSVGRPRQGTKSRTGGAGGGGAHRKCVDAGDRAAP